jgi:hypothetical protein
MVDITTPVHATTNEAKWKRIAERYLDLWNLPNCIGSIDGKHIRIKCFPKSGSLYFNYKGYFSVVLLACADTDALFTTVHVGDFGKNSDGSVFRASTLGKILEKEELHIPFPTSLPLDDSVETFPYYFVADEEFPLKINLMRPYPRKMLTNKRRNCEKTGLFICLGVEFPSLPRVALRSCCSFPSLRCFIQFHVFTRPDRISSKSRLRCGFQFP